MNKFEACRFSIVIPCYNEAEFIGSTLKSIKLQDTKEKYEVIIVDNNCTDETVAIARQYGARIIEEQNPGVCCARQAGTIAANGEIIISTDADTIFRSNWLSNIDRSFKNNSKLVAIGGPCRYVDGPWWGKVYTYFLFTAVYLYYLLTGHPFYVTATNIAFKKSAWNGYDMTSMQGGDELDLLHRLKRKGRVGFTNLNSTYTSGRRLNKGLAYNIFVSFLFYYLGEYYINKLFKRTIIGSAPAFRGERSGGLLTKLGVGVVTCFLFVYITSISTPTLRSFISDNIENTSNAALDLWRTLI